VRLDVPGLTNINPPTSVMHPRYASPYMKLFVTISLLLLTILANGQVENDIRKSLSAGYLKEFNILMDSLYKLKRPIQVYRKTDRELVNGFREMVFQVERSVPKANNRFISTVYTFRLNLLVTDSDFVFYDFSEEKGRIIKGKTVTSYPTIIKYKNDSLYNLLKAEFNKSYNSNLNVSELFIEPPVYGTLCGRTATPPAERTKINNLVKTKNKAELLKWLKSTITEKQIYAIDGLYQLKRQGMKFSAEELKCIKNVLNKKGYAYTCSGCIYGQECIAELVKEFKF
jgi:hypothetical protein